MNSAPQKFLVLFHLLFIATSAMGESLDLANFLHLLLRENLRLQTLGLGPSLALEDLRAARGQFDPLLSVGLQQTGSRRQSITGFASESSLESAEESLDTTLSRHDSAGRSYGLTYRVNRTRAGGSSGLNPAYGATLEGTVKIPLRRGGGADQNLFGERSARIDREKAVFAVREGVVSAVAEGRLLFLDYAAVLEEQRLNDQSLDNSQRLLARARDQLDVGSGSQLDCVQAENGVISREKERRRMAGQVKILLVQAGHLLNNLASPPETLVIDDSVFPQLMADGEEGLWHRSREFDPQFQILRKNLEREGLILRRTRREGMAKLDIEATFAANGLGESHAEAGATARQGRFPSHAVGVRTEWPWENRVARARNHHQELKIREAVLSLAQREQTLLKEIKSARLAIETQDELIALAEQNSTLSEKEYSAEWEKFQAGNTTSYDVLVMEERVRQAGVALFRHKIDRCKAIIRLQSLTGDLFTHPKIELEAVVSNE